MPTNDVEKGVSLAYALKCNSMRGRVMNGEIGGSLIAHVMPSVIFSDEQYSDIISINRDRVDSSTVVNFSAGVTADNWSAEVYMDNVTDEHAETARNFVNDRQRVTPMRPMTIGLRFMRDF